MGGHKSKQTIDPSERTVTVALKDLNRLCHECGVVKSTVWRREYLSKNYQGPCGDSFCYASCDMEACRPVTKQICVNCLNKLAK